ncbi:NAD-dependent epimerase [Bordetella genomosp. 9]|uniref:NAD-dependent epimerase n=1 Tax=Bordetella genomosp. 9 TaxID=1416803 RepID=A0A261R882_9BORD|nr:NAD-dependent epimerase/dehydratase family protein [Bordetella genomosp. 9]OZI20987.1 NAD-dependent epimerase [Bordetella genomosp. 9]
MNTENTRILVIGANGQLGTELVEALATRHGADRIVTADIRAEGPDPDCVHELLDVTSAEALESVVARHRIGQIYNLAAALSATAEVKPQWAWDLNMTGLLNVLEIARRQGIRKVFWPSSIAAFGPSTPKHGAPQQTVMDPETVYGISKLAGEGWCRWYRTRNKVDVRSLRYPGLISYKTAPGGGTTDYAVDIFHQALRTGSYRCFLNADQELPMMYMADAVRATIELMDAPVDRITEFGSYNLAGFSVTPDALTTEIRKRIPDFRISYAPDFRQAIAASWPSSIDDSRARSDWGWMPQFDLRAMVPDMLAHVREMITAEPCRA